MTSDGSRLATTFVGALTNRDERVATRSFEELGERFLVDGQISPDVFEKLSSAVLDSSVQVSPQAPHLLKTFEYNLELLDAAQRERLAACLEGSVGAFDDPAAGILAVELMVELLDGDRALQILSRQLCAREDFSREMAVYGLRRLARSVADPALTAGIVSRIRGMTRDPSRVVQAEARRSLEQLTGG